MPESLQSKGFYRSRIERSKSWWSLGLVFIPLLLLAGLGIRGLQVGRQAAREGARREAEQMCRHALQMLNAGMRELRNAPPVKRYEVPPQPSGSSRAQELYFQTFHTDADHALPILDELAAQHADAYLESGLPLLPLVEWRRLQLSRDDSDLIGRAEALARTAVETHPSVLTPELLSRADAFVREHGVETSALNKWGKQWVEDEQLRKVLKENEASLKTARSPLWIQSDGRLWLAENSSNEQAWRLLPKERIAAVASAVLDELKGTLPDYISVEISLVGVALARQLAGEVLTRTEEGDFVISGVLHDPAELYAEQNRQTLWLAALLGCGIMAAFGGTWMMNSALTRERQLNELKSDFVSSVSHELRAPVASMRIMVENLGSGIVTDEARRREYHQLIADECWRLSTLIENVLDLARIERNRKTYRFAESDVAALVRDAVQLLQPRAAQRRQEIHIDIPMPLEPPPICDSLAVQQALINLLDNAIKFSPEKAVITVRLATCGGEQWELSVIDQGPGIPKEEQVNVFERFYRLGSELQRETQGTGIGLSIVKHIAEGHGGRAVLENQPQGGARFSLLLPRIPPGIESEPAVQWPVS